MAWLPKLNFLNVGRVQGMILDALAGDPEGTLKGWADLFLSGKRYCQTGHYRYATFLLDLISREELQALCSSQQYLQIQVVSLAFDKLPSKPTLTQLRLLARVCEWPATLPEDLAEGSLLPNQIGHDWIWSMAWLADPEKINQLLQGSQPAPSKPPSVHLVKSLLNLNKVQLLPLSNLDPEGFLRSFLIWTDGLDQHVRTDLRDEAWCVVDESAFCDWSVAQLQQLSGGYREASAQLGYIGMPLPGDPWPLADYWRRAVLCKVANASGMTRLRNFAAYAERYEETDDPILRAAIRQKAERFYGTQLGHMQDDPYGPKFSKIDLVMGEAALPPSYQELLAYISLNPHVFTSDPPVTESL